MNFLAPAVKGLFSTYSCHGHARYHQFESNYNSVIIFFLFYTEMLVNKQVIPRGHWNLPPKNQKLQKVMVFALRQEALCGLKQLARRGGLLRYVMLLSSGALSYYFILFFYI